MPDDKKAEIVVKVELNTNLKDMKGKDIKEAVEEDGKVAFKVVPLRDAFVTMLSNYRPSHPKESFLVQDLGCAIATEKEGSIELNVKRIDLLRKLVKENLIVNRRTGEKEPIYPAYIQAQLLRAVGLTEEDV